MDDNEFLGARDQLDIDVVDEREWPRTEREYDASDAVGDPLLLT
jgi:hypothetical protein